MFKVNDIVRINASNGRLLLLWGVGETWVNNQIGVVIATYNHPYTYDYRVLIPAHIVEKYTGNPNFNYTVGLDKRDIENV